MSVFNHFSRTNLTRFAGVIRQQGWRVALAKTKSYLSRAGVLYGRWADRHHRSPEAYLTRFWQDMARSGSFHISQPPALLTRTRKIALIGDLNLPQCRKYRAEQLVEFWGGMGVDCDFSHYQDVPRSTALLQDASHAMFYRGWNGPLNSLYLYEARRLRLPVLYDLDDPLFSVSAYETYENMKALPPRTKAHFVNEAPKYLDAMNLADIVTVSTPDMAEHTRLYTPRPVYFRRNFADRDTFAAADAALAVAGRTTEAPFRVCFASGSMGHEVDFALIAEDVITFLDAAPDRQLVILGHFDEKLLPVALRDRIEAHKFTSYPDYLATLATVDCAVMPLTDDIFNRCKSAVRVIDAAAVAVPSIVGQVSDMAEMVQDGVTGRVLAPGASWGAALEALAGDRAACAEMGRAARADLKANWGARPGLPIVEQPVLDWVLGMTFPGHILIANVFFAPHSYGGATIVAEQVARELVHRHGRRVSAISVMTRPDLTAYKVMKVEKHGIQNYLINLPPHRSYAEIYDNPQVTQIVAGLLDVLQPDLLHAHCLQDIGTGILSLAHRRGLPTVLSVHDFWWLCEHQFMIRPSQRYCGQDPIRIEACRGCVDSLPRARARQDTILNAAAQVDLITFPSRFAQDLSVRSGMTAARTAVWGNGVRLPGPAFFDAQAARRAKDDRPVFGFVGGPSQTKGWPLLRVAFEGLERDDFAGYLVDGSLQDSWWRGHDISSLAGDWQLHPRFEQAEMDAFYARIDVLLFLSQWKETFGLAIREAAARGIRVLQTDSGGTTEWEGARPEEMLSIGDGPEKLQAALLRELDRPQRGIAPVAVTSYPDQAQAFLDMVAPLETKDRRSKRKRR